MKKLYPEAFPDAQGLFHGLSQFGHFSPAHYSHISAALYANDPQIFLAHGNEPHYFSALLFYIRKMLGGGRIDLNWLSSRNKAIQATLCLAFLACYFSEATLHPDTRALLDMFYQLDLNDIQHDSMHYFSALVCLFSGKMAGFSSHQNRISKASAGLTVSLQATTAFLAGQYEAASPLYRKALTALRKQYDNRLYYFDTFLVIFYNICLVYVDKQPGKIATNMTHYERYRGNYAAVFPLVDSHRMLMMLPLIEQGECAIAEARLNKMLSDPDKPGYHPVLIALFYLLRFMADKSYIGKNSKTILAQSMQFQTRHHLMATCILNELLLEGEQQEAAARALEQNEITLRLLPLIQVKDAWEYRFQALESMLLQDFAAVSGKRLLWLLNPDSHDISVVEQSINKSGSWSAGRAVSLEKLKHHHEHEQFNYLTDADKAALDCLVGYEDGWRRSYYEFHEYRAWQALIGHSNLVHQRNRDMRLELVRAEPELIIDERKGGYHMSLSHWRPEACLILEAESMNRYRVINFSPAFASIAQILTENGLTVPASSKDKILRVIQQARRDIQIHTALSDVDIPEIAGDPTPCVQLLPTADGVSATLWVKPLDMHGTYCKAGEGKDRLMVMLTDNGEEIRTRVVRDFAAEKKAQAAVLKHCPNLPQYESEPGEYDIDGVEACLDVLSELQSFAEKQPLNMEWPQGQTFRIKQRVNHKSLSMSVSSGSNWFEYEGKLTLNDGQVLGMQALLDALAAESHGRFVRLGDGDFIELTSQLKKQLQILSTLSDDNKINVLGAQVLSDIVAGAESSQFDAGWEAHVKKMKNMKAHSPKVPSTLQTNLRDYQIEGFHYLSRLTHWGIGACLADDMGLGKTVQTIALLLERAKKGAALVVAPTSVAFNWMEELNKFAPSLKVHNLRSDDRATLVKEAGPFDVLVCSYGLLQHNGDLLTDKQWETIVLDEAQAIKNANTQRWKTVMKLKGNNRIALSGTPIENHLGELWSIFSFINPGLLGTIKSFQNKYSAPIESKQSPDTLHALRALVSPYILRRIKSEVLTELPPKTEQTIHVEQSTEEAVFYEALRRNAQERMTSLMADNDRIGVLAEISKLRQACCDSSLIDSAVSIANSKLTSFMETLKNIIDNGHKALVFSQYVSFLAIVKQRIEEEKIDYQYLDGSTSPAKRKSAVNAFQAGEGDVFLLSLKAGGSGLNLTAADYVIHLDPWWNPAVEDQASDRAHRIGQERPVTVYRFVMQNTIEEKIIALHEHKRHLANELLSGQGISGKLSNEDLMSLITRY